MKKLELTESVIFHNMTVDQRSGWGYFTDSKYLSIILKPDETHS